MQQYRVVERWVEVKQCVLQCNSGRYHVARVLNVMPPAEAALGGSKPHLGFDILVCAGSGAIFRVIFESIDNAHVVKGPGRTRNLPSGAARASAQAFGSAG